MKALVIGNEARAQKYMPNVQIVRDTQIVYASLSDGVQEILAKASDAEFIVADAIAKVPAELIRGMPSLKLIHSEGVATNGIDIAAAAEAGVLVCNCKGLNAGAVAEQAILLMLALQRSLIAGDAAVRAARQIEMKERLMVQGMRELGDSVVGIIGLGAIGQALAKRLAAGGSVVLYYNDNRRPQDVEQACGAQYAALDELLAQSDIVSLHVPVTPKTTNMANAEFFAKMKPGALLINTARGEVVDQEALCEALASGQVGGAGLDTLAPEPVQASNPLLSLPPDAASRVVFSPHAGGITEGLFRRAYKVIWSNIASVAAGEQPINVVGA